MPTESLRTLEAAVEAWNRRDMDGVTATLAEDVIWVVGGRIPGSDDAYQGRHEVLRFFEQFREPWEEISVEILDVIEDREDQIVVRVRFHGTGREGIAVDGNFLQIYRYDERHLCREFRVFAEDEEREALSEAGLDGRADD